MGVTKRRDKRSMMTKAQRHSSLFQRRIIIPIPSWGVFVVAVAVAVSLWAQPLLITNVISLTCTGVALIFVLVARRHVRALRHDVHEALHNINNDDLEITDDDDEVDAESFTDHITLKKLRVNGTHSARVSE